MKAATRQAVRDALCAVGRAARPVIPQTLVTSFAGIGQVLWALDQVAPPAWVWPARLALAIGAAAAVEVIALDVQWHGHDAYLRDQHATAARLRRASYLIATVVAGVNYSHFCAAGGGPTPAAVMFALFSLVSPWLWGLHTRRVHEIRIAESGGVVDVTGAAFAPIRWRLYPIQTWKALRWSVAHYVSDPRAAWEGSRGEPVGDTPPATPEPVAEHRPAAVALATTAPVVRAHAHAPGTDDDAAVLARARAHAAAHGPIGTEKAFRTATSLGYTRARRLWPTFQQEQETSA